MMNPVAQTNGSTAQSGAGAPQFASLYVGDLDADVTEAMLYEIFNTVGPVASIRVCRDSVTRRSLGYAYVNFHSAGDAERVMDTLNYSTIKGRCCRIMWSHRDPNLRKTGNGNVFVKNLDKNVDNKALFDTFSLFGNILSCKVATDSEGKSRGYGFVHYETFEAAKQAIDKVNGMQIGEKTVYVGEFIPRDGRTAAEIVNFTNIYVKNYPADWEEERLLQEFGKFGKITSSMVQKDKKNRPFAFLNYETAEGAKGAIDEMHKKDLRSAEEQAEFPDGPPNTDAEKATDADEHPEHLMFVSRAMTKSERESMLKNKFKASSTAPVGVNLYIKNLPDDCSDNDLKLMFQTFGEITSARVMCDSKSRSKGFGFVCYKTPEEATKAVTEMHLKTVKGKPLYVGLAEKKDERSNRLAQRYKGEKKGGLVMFNDKGQSQMGGGKGGTMAYNAGYPGGVQQMKGGNQMMLNPMQNMRPPMAAMGANYMAAQRSPIGVFPGMGMPMQMGKGFPGNPLVNQMGKGGPQPPSVGQRLPQNGPRPDQSQVLTAQMLSTAPPGMQKQMLGEKLYPAVSRLQPDLAGKITGMMLEMDNNELLMMLESETQLRQKVDEAMRVLSNMK